MTKRKEVIYLTEKQVDVVEKMKKDGTDDILDVYANQAYNYGLRDGTDFGIVGSAFAILAGFGAAKLYNYVKKKKEK